MNMIKSISFLFLTVSCLLILSRSAVCADDIQDQSNQAKLDEDIAEIKSKLSFAKQDFWLQRLDWTRYGNTVLYIITTENDTVFVSELIEWLLRGINDWDVPNREIRKFLSDTKNIPDRSEVRLKLLNLLLIKAALAEYSKPQFTEFLFDPMPIIRKRMIQVLKEGGTIEAIPALEKAIEISKTTTPLSSDASDEINLLQDSIRSIRLWDERSNKQWEATKEEIHEQCKVIEQLVPNELPEGHQPGFYDGCRYIIDRWPRFKWGVKSLLNSDTVSERRKSQVISLIVNRVGQEYWDEAISWILSYYKTMTGIESPDNPQELKSVRKYVIVKDIFSRKSMSDFQRFSNILISFDPSDIKARVELLRICNEIGTEDCLPELRHAADFWREKNKPGTVQAIEKSIQAIEQRLRIIPTVTPVNSGS